MVGAGDRKQSSCPASCNVDLLGCGRKVVPNSARNQESRSLRLQWDAGGWVPPQRSSPERIDSAQREHPMSMQDTHYQ
jgi:hypothetical protein